MPTFEKAAIFGHAQIANLHEKKLPALDYHLKLYWR